MTTDQNGSAPDSGAPTQAPDQSNPEPKQPQDHLIPKRRFDQVVGQKKAAEAQLEADEAAKASKGADGEELNYQGCDIYTFRGGKICAKDTYWKIVEHKDRL